MIWLTQQGSLDLISSLVFSFKSTQLVILFVQPLHEKEEICKDGGTYRLKVILKSDERLDKGNSSHYL